MVDEHWNKLKTIFADAVEIAESERKEFVERACGGDKELEAEVNSLLAAHELPDDPIENNVLDLRNEITSGRSSQLERKFAHYSIIEEIGHGGMGTVYLAERADGEFKQRVALKLVRQTIADPVTEKRFRREREILASLNHPYIAQLHDGGVSEAGEPYFAMEYVEGKPVLEHAAAQKLDLNARLRLFLKICSAVAFAHRNLTVHRDIKPSNILIDADGNPKLLDFGLAKLLDENMPDAEQTVTEYRAFTPAYASPEQILGKKITAVSDIYSLGVVFYEILTGEKPFRFDGKSLEQIVLTITNTKPTRPSSVFSSKTAGTAAIAGISGLNNDIDNIVLKCLQKDPSQRYQTVEDLAADIRRYLDGQPILARPSTFTYRASKFVRRNKVAVAAAAVVVVSILTGFVFSLWQANLARRERDRAERRFQDVRKLSTSLLFEITPKIETLEGSTEAREILVTRALEYLDSLAGESAGDVDLQAELALAYEKIGELQGHPSKPNLGDLAGSLTSFEKANSIRLVLPETYVNRRLLAENYRHLADAKYWQGDTAGSLDALMRSKAIYESLVAEHPEDDSLLLSFLKILTELSQYYQSNNQYAEAVKYAESVIERSAALDRSARETRELVAVTSADLGNSLSWNGDQMRAEAVMGRGVSEMETLLSEMPKDARSRHLMWRVYMLASGIFEEINDVTSMKYAEQALATAAKGVENDPADIQAKHNLARSNYRVGVVAVNLKQIARAVLALDTSKGLFEGLIRREPRNRFYQSDLARIHTRIGLAKRLQNDIRGSNESFLLSMELWQKIVEADPANKNARRDVALAQKNLGENYAKIGNAAAAKVNLRQAIEILNSLKAENALPEVDNKLLGELESAVAKF